MDEKLKQFYRPAALDQYRWQQRLTIRVAASVFGALIRLIGRTVKVETIGEEHLASVTSAGQTPIYVLWHDRIFLGTFYLRDRGIVVITSQSFDGEYIARFLTSFGFGTVRGSSTRGGTGALVELIKLVRQGIPGAFTIDGPKGPRYVAKPGACLLAKKTGAPILPFIFVTARHYTVGSWDRLQIPFPFTRGCAIYGEPIFVSPDADEEMLASSLREVQKSLDELVIRGEQWRSSNKQ